MTAMARIRSRRKPKLRLVGAEGSPTRHAGIMKWLETDWVVEVWPFADFDRLAVFERPEQNKAIMLPGLGFVAVRRPLSQMEQEDVQDVQWQAEAQWRVERGLD